MNSIHHALIALAEKVCERASFDPDFRALALSDGRAALRFFSLEPLNTDVAVRFVDHAVDAVASGTRVFVLPALINIGTEISETELVAMEGGECGCSASCGITCFCSACCITKC